jgi:hypothetical protein
MTKDSQVNGRGEFLSLCSSSGSTYCEIAFGVYNDQHSRGPMTLSNNYFDGPGLGFITDNHYRGAEFDTTLVTRRNWYNIPRSQHWNNAASDGRRYGARQPWEIKRGARVSVLGNIFNGAFAYQNGAPSIFLSGRGIGGSHTGTGISDVWIRSNTIAHAAMGWECSGNINASNDSLPVRRVLFENNLLYDLDRFTYDNSGPGGFNTGYFTSYSACQGVRYRNNSHGAVGGLGPYIAFGGGDDIRGGRLDMRDNLMYYSKGNDCAAHGVNFDTTPQNATYRSLPALATGTATQKFEGYWAKLGAGTTTPNIFLSNNVMIGGRCTAVDLTQAETTAVAAGSPSGTSGHWEKPSQQDRRPLVYLTQLLTTTDFCQHLRTIGLAPTSSPLSARISTC